MKTILMSLFAGIASLFAPTKTFVPTDGATTSLYQFKAKSLEGKEIDFSQYKGKKVLIVNTASECGYTPQYAELEKLHDQYKDKLVVIGFPCNDFGGQEPGSAAEIKTFCQKNYGVSFLMMDKVTTKGEQTAPIYKWLIAQTKQTPSWNFCKYLIDGNGQVIKFFPSRVGPLDKDLTSLL
jgi:glutathione peroxidase